jgi:hypothetical protein
MAKAADGTCAEVDLGRVDLDEADTLAVSERNRVPVGYSRQAGEAEGAQQRVNQLVTDVANVLRQFYFSLTAAREMLSTP